MYNNSVGFDRKNDMSVIKDIIADVEDLVSSTDMTAYEIAEQLNVPVDMVFDALDYLEENFDCDVDEAQEWHDFDPDC
jgi:hypothetical protein